MKITFDRVVVVSALAHALVFACIMHAKHDLAPAAPVDTPTAPELELEAPTVETPPADDNTQPNERSAEVATATSPHSARSASGFVSGALGGGAPAGSAVPSVEPAGSNSTWVVDLGNAVVQPFRAAPPSGNGFGPTRQQMEAEERALQLPHKDDSLKHSLALQDAAKGLGVDGPVLHALEDETRRSLAPLRGSATFHAIVDATGFVTSLTITDSSGDTMGWNDARDLALAALQKKKIDLHAAKNGVAFDILVESKMRLPAGNEVTEFGVKDGMLTMSGDLANVGSKPQRVVHARLTNYQPL